jgi:hypothetical protein
LFSGDTNGNLSGYSDGFAFGAAQNGVSFGRYVISTGEAQYPAQIVNTLGQTNAGPRVGPLVINEINYHPPIAGDEFIELRSITNAVLPLYNTAYPTNTWRLNGVGFVFPTNIQVAPNGLVLLVAGDPTAFRSKFAVPSSVPIFGPYPGRLQGGGETLSLQRPDVPDLDTNTGAIFIPLIDVDVVKYDDKAPWPNNAAGLGASLERISASAYGNDPINWRASPNGPSPGIDNIANSAPVLTAGPDQTLMTASLPIAVLVAGTATDDGRPNPPGKLTISWSQVSGPLQASFSNPAQASTTVTLLAFGDYVFRLTGSDGALVASDDVTIHVAFTGQGPAPFPIDSVDILPGNPPLLRLRFTAMAGQSYTVQVCGTLASSAWSKLTDVPAQGSAHTAEITDAIPPSTSSRFYRVVTPGQ